MAYQLPVIPVHVVRCSFDPDGFANPSDPYTPGSPLLLSMSIPDFLNPHDWWLPVYLNWVNFCWASFSQSGHSYVGCLARSSEKALHKSLLLWCLSFCFSFQLIQNAFNSIYIKTRKAIPKCIGQTSNEMLVRNPFAIKFRLKPHPKWTGLIIFSTIVHAVSSYTCISLRFGKISNIIVGWWRSLRSIEIWV